MEVQLWQITLLALYAGIAIFDGLHLCLFFQKPVVAGMVAGIIMGDMQTGLIVGGTLQLMALGVSTYGGASVPDYLTGSIIGTVFAITTGQGVEFAVSVGVPAALLLVNLDILARMTNTFFQHKADSYVEKRDYKKVCLMNVLGAIPWILSRAVPVFLILFFGVDLVDSILAVTPQWVLTGMKVAGGLLPAIGVAILMRYLPVKNYAAYLVIGFVAAAYMKISVLGVALLGGALAYIRYNQRLEEKTAPAVAQGGFDEDE